LSIVMEFGSLVTHPSILADAASDVDGKPLYACGIIPSRHLMGSSHRDRIVAVGFLGHLNAAIT
jgi:hypothetical protein